MTNHSHLHSLFQQQGPFSLCDWQRPIEVIRRCCQRIWKSRTWLSARHHQGWASGRHGLCKLGRGFRKNHSFVLKLNGCSIDNKGLCYLCFWTIFYFHLIFLCCCEFFCQVLVLGLFWILRRPNQSEYSCLILHFFYSWGFWESCQGKELHRLRQLRIHQHRYQENHWWSFHPFLKRN